MRKIIFIILVLVRNGYKRARLLKNLKYFHTQGENCFFATLFFGTEPKHISFGSNVWLATRVSLITHDVSVLMINNYLKNKNLALDFVGYIKIGNNVFVGANSTILPNVSITDNVVIGANSVVTKSITEAGVYVGNPIRKVKSFSEFCNDVKNKHSGYPWGKLLLDRAKNKKTLEKLRRDFVTKFLT